MAWPRAWAKRERQTSNTGSGDRPFSAFLVSALVGGVYPFIDPLGVCWYLFAIFFYTNEWVYKPFFDSSRERYGRAMVDTPCHPLLICPLKASLSNLLSRVALKILEGCKSVRDESEPKDFTHFSARDRWSPVYGSEPQPMRIFDQGICTNN